MIVTGSNSSDMPEEGSNPVRKYNLPRYLAVFIPLRHSGQ